MNTKPNLALIAIAILFVAAACSPVKSSSSVLDPAQPATRNDKVLPVTGVQAPNTAQDLEAYPSQQLHSECVSEDSQRQVNCVDKEPDQSTALTLHIYKNNSDADTYPSQQLHSDCASEDSQRQDSCTP